MAYVEKLPSGKYRAVYRDSNGGRHTVKGTFPGKRAAREAANAAELAIRSEQGRTPDRRRRLTWSQWEAEWTPTRTVAASTLREDAGRIRLHVRPRWGDVALTDITRGDVQSWVAALSSAGAAPSTVHKVVGVLSASLAAAARSDLIELNPATDLQKPSIGPSPERWLSDIEVDAIRDVIDDGHRFMFELLVGSGMRWGEATALHWSDVDLDAEGAEGLRVMWSLDRKAGVIKGPKTNKGREVPIGPTLASVLRARLAEWGRGDAPDGYTYTPNRRPTTGLVAATNAGTAPNPTSFGHALSAAGKAAFIGEGPNRRRVGHVRPHDLRHTFASKLVRNGIPIDEVSRRLGHGNLTMTMRYASAGQSNFNDVRRALG